MGRMVDADDLMSSADVAALLAVTRQSVSNYKKRHPGFPEPVAKIGPKGNIDVYLRSEVLPWVIERIPADLRAAIREHLDATEDDHSG